MLFFTILIFIKVVIKYELCVIRETQIHFRLINKKTIDNLNIVKNKGKFYISIKQHESFCY